MMGFEKRKQQSASVAATRSTEYAFRVALVGDSESGKGSLLSCYLTLLHDWAPDKASAASEETSIWQRVTGTNFAVVRTLVADVKARVEVWDHIGRRAGSSKLNDMQDFYRGIDGFIFVYNLGDSESFEAVKLLWELAHFVNPRSPCVLVGNKLHLCRQGRRAVSQDSARSWASARDCVFLETNPRTGAHVQQAFEVAMREVLFAATQRDAFRDYHVSLPVPLAQSNGSAAHASPVKVGKDKGSKQLHVAVASGNLDMATKLCSSRTINSHDNVDRSTPLHLAIRTLMSDAVTPVLSMLLEHSAVDLNAVNKARVTPLMEAARLAWCNVGLLLIERGASLTHADVDGNTFIHHAVEAGAMDLILPHLCASNVDTANRHGDTPLLLACAQGDVHVVEALLAHGAQCSRSMGRGRMSVLHVACQFGNRNIVAALLEHEDSRTYINALTQDGLSPLHIAANYRHMDLVHVLLEAGADPRIGKHHERLCSDAVFRSFTEAHVALALSSRAKRLDLSRTRVGRVPSNVFQMSWLTHLNLSQCSLSVIPRAIISLVHLEALFLQDNHIASIPPTIYALTALQQLDLSRNIGISQDISRIILCAIGHARTAQDPTVQQQTEDFSTLNLGRLQLTALSPSLSSVTHLTQLSLANNEFDSLPVGVGVLTNLEHLWLQHNRIRFWPAVMADMAHIQLLRLSHNALRHVPPMPEGTLTQLRELWLEHNELDHFPSHLRTLPSLSRLWLDHNMIPVLGEHVHQFSNLVYLSLKNNEVRELPESIGDCSGLRRLWLDGNQIHDLPKCIASLTQLEVLSLARNRLSALPDSLGSLCSLVELNVEDNKVVEVSPKLGSLRALRRMKLARNDITIVPITIGYLTELDLLDVSGNLRLTSPPPATVKRGLTAMLGFLQDLMKDNVASYRMKLMIVGQENVGKTTLLRALRSKKNVAKGKAPLSTDGIDIASWTVKVRDADGSSVKMSLYSWDFAGQEVYYTTHSFFLSARSMFLVVWSLEGAFQSDGSCEASCLGRVKYWLQSIEARAPQAPVLLVGTHAALMTAEQIVTYSRTVTDILSSAFPTLSLLAFAAVDCKTGQSVPWLRDCIHTSALAQPFMGEPMPLTYMSLEKAVLHEKVKHNPPILHWQAFRKLAATCNIIAEEELRRATTVLHDLGSLVYFGDHSERLADLVILDAQWLTKVMAQVISTKSSFVVDGLLQHSALAHIWRAPNYPPELHAQLLEMMEAFEMLYRMDTGDVDLVSGKSLVPALLPPYVSHAVPQWASCEAASELGRVYAFSFLPKGFFSRLMVRLLHFAPCLLHCSNMFVLHHGASVAVVSLDEGNTCIQVRIRCGEGMQCDAARAGMGGRVEAEDTHSRVSDAAEVLHMVVDSIDALVEDWYRVDTKVSVPCTHCMQRWVASEGETVVQQLLPPPRDTFVWFGLEHCESLASGGRSYAECGDHSLVLLQHMCPDVVVSNVSNVEWSELHNVQRIGQGSFALVYRAEYGDDVVAVKSLIDESDYRELRREAMKMHGLLHANIVRLVGVCLMPPSLITEYLAGGSLFDWLCEPDRPFPWVHRQRIALDVARGMAYLHGATPAIVHRDLKSANVLLGEDGVAKVADFGTIQAIAPTTSGRAVTNPRWLAPEVLRNEPYTGKSDVYSFGMIMFELVTRCIPFMDQHRYKWAHNVEDDVIDGVRPPIPEDCPQSWAILMAQCWHASEDVRPTFSQVVAALQQMIDRGEAG